VSLSPNGLFALVTDLSSHLIRLIDISTSDVTTLAGTRLIATAIDGMGTNAKFSSPYRVSIASNGTFAWVSDYGNHIVRRLSLEQLSESPTLLPTSPPSIAPTTSPSLKPTASPSLPSMVSHKTSQGSDDNNDQTIAIIVGSAKISPSKWNSISSKTSYGSLACLH
jgi:hypothetical protein